MSTISQDTIAPVSYALAAKDADAFSDALCGSFREYGFAVIADHGVDQTAIDRAIADTKAFFALPDPVKRQYHLTGGGGQRGYTPFGVEAAKGAKDVDLKEFWHRGRDLPEGHRYEAVMPRNVPVAEIETFDETTAGLFSALDEMGGTLLKAIARHLDLPEDWFVPAVNEGNSILRLLHYPPVDADPKGVRAGAHEDINVITLLLGAEEAGLQVKTRSGDWLPINPPPGALVVNVGDMLQRLTNHVLPSTTHRVVNPPKERMGFSRYSTPFFLHFNPDFEIATLPQCVSAGNPDRYPAPITAHDYLMERLREIRLA
jgi:isopenicillin N synthase-like dioxygenase